MIIFGGHIYGVEKGKQVVAGHHYYERYAS